MASTIATWASRLAAGDTPPDQNTILLREQNAFVAAVILASTSIPPVPSLLVILPRYLSLSTTDNALLDGSTMSPRLVLSKVDGLMYEAG